MNFENLIKETVEYQNMGSWNEVSISFLVSIILMAIQAFGMWKQKKKIGTGKKEKTFLSLILFSFIFSYYICYGIYGIYKHSLTIILNNFFLGLFFIPIIKKIVKYKIKGNGLSRLELSISPFLLLIIPGIILIPNKDLFLSIMLVFLGLAIIPQGVQFIKEKDDLKENNDFEPIFIVTILLTNIIWLILGLEMGSLALISSSIPTILVTSITLIIYYWIKIVNRKRPDRRK